MGYIVEITEDKVEGLAEHAKKILKHGKELYECIEELAESSMGERGGYGRYGNRYDGGGRYGNRMGMRNDDDWEDDDPYMGERRERSSRTGRYIRR